jgi:hypothetical protein
MRRVWTFTAILSLAIAACAGRPAPSATPTTRPIPTTEPAAGTTTTTTPETVVPEPPPVPTGPLKASLIEDLNTVIDSLSTTPNAVAIARIGESGDPRVAWFLTDFLRFIQFGASSDAARAAFEQLTGASLSGFGAAWVDATNLLLVWDLPAPPEYFDLKRRVFVLAEERWAPFFDEASTVDWRYVSWGGVFIDDRPAGDESACSRGCIPALDDPAVTRAEDGLWYPDSALVFGVVVNGEARAYPKNLMEVHEMVNDRLGGRRLGIPYCTLCGSAQAYLTDEVPESITPPLLRTSGLLLRSNKMMFDLNTYSLIDTFRGVALTGPLADQNLVLPQVSVVTSTWGEWKAAHPETTIIAQDGGIGFTYPEDPLGGRDAGGPIFPIGEVDPRLPLQTQVLGVETPDGLFVAFPVDQALAVLDAGATVELAGVRLQPDGGGLLAETQDGKPLASHQSFWFAWSQFHSDTLLWSDVLDN